MRAMLGCIDTLGSYASLYKRYGAFATDHSIGRNIRRLKLNHSSSGPTPDNSDFNKAASGRFLPPKPYDHPEHVTEQS